MLKTIPDWAKQVAERSRATADPRLGTLRRVDAAARLRGLQAVEKAEVLALGRPVLTSGGQSHTGRPPFELEVEVLDNNRLTIGTDRIAIDCHGLGVTHIDGINHFGVEGLWFAGADARESGPSIGDWAEVGLVTRAILLDVAAARQGGYVAIDKPVVAADFKRALAASGVQIEPGDALLVHMGRESFEPAYGPMKPIVASPEGRPGIGADGAQWLAEQPVSAILWDMLDAYNDQEEPFCVHLLIWAQGLALIDNCNLSAVRAAMADRKKKTALVVVAPLNIPGGTGSAVNPLVLL